MIIKDLAVSPEVRLESTLPFYHPEIRVLADDLVSYLKVEAERWAWSKVPYLSAVGLCIRLQMGDAGYCLAGLEMCLLGEVDVQILAKHYVGLETLAEVSVEAFVLNTHDEEVRPRLVFVAADQPGTGDETEVWNEARKLIEKDLQLANDHLSRKADRYLATCTGTEFPEL